MFFPRTTCLILFTAAKFCTMTTCIYFVLLESEGIIPPPLTTPIINSEKTTVMTFWFAIAVLCMLNLGQVSSQCSSEESSVDQYARTLESLEESAIDTEQSFKDDIEQKQATLKSFEKDLKTAKKDLKTCKQDKDDNCFSETNAVNSLENNIKNQKTAIKGSKKNQKDSAKGHKEGIKDVKALLKKAQSALKKCEKENN